MPESVTDRPTKAHEYVFLLSKSSKYFFDQEAVRERGNGWKNSNFDDPRDLEKHPNVGRKARSPAGWKTGAGSHGSIHQDGREQEISYNEIDHGRNIRTVWEIATQPFKEAHFATFPEELVKNCMFAGTSEKGCCPKCGVPWVRVVEKYGGTIGKGWHDHSTDKTTGQRFIDQDASHGRHGREPYMVNSVGWQPSCDCGENPTPCTVLDPFIGSCTVGVVAQKYNRKWVGCELKMDYCKMGQKRVFNTNIAMI